MVLFKNHNKTWQSHWAGTNNFGAYADNSANFLLISNIVSLLSIEHEKYRVWCLFVNYGSFGTTLSGKWAWPLSRHCRLGLKTLLKMWPTGWTFWASCYVEIIHTSIWDKILRSNICFMIHTYLTIYNRASYLYIILCLYIRKIQFRL